jgi:uncharacterized protein YkwD
MSALLLRFRRTLIALLAAACAATGVVALGSQPATATTSSDIAYQLFLQLNNERAANHLYALTSTPYLRTGSAAYHDGKMAYYNVFAHQVVVSGFTEPSLATRVVNAGFTPWSTIGENIAWTSDMTLRGAQALQNQMYNEVPPNNGHRLNILSTSFQYVGIDVYMDTRHGKMWLTFDFGRH